MSKRLDLSEYHPVTRTECHDHPHDVAQDYNFILTEALRAQAAEDALRERVRVLEEESLTALMDATVSVGNHTDASDLLSIGLRAIRIQRHGCTPVKRVAGGHAEMIREALTGGNEVGQ
jgi:hypothetical protein